MNLVGWLIIGVVVVALAYYVTRMAKDREDGERHDPGLAILEFGRAFPTEAIRALHETVDGKAVFVRLHDNKAGIMRNYGRHYACHVIKPGRARATILESGKGFVIEFLDAPTQNGEFVFPSEEIAAEVGLWLLGNFVSADGAVADENGKGDEQPTA